jgi:hypothetical protein
MQFLKNFTNTISYRYAERIAGDSVVDLGASYTLNAFELSLFANNIFNTEYTETNLVPMPKGNYLECNITLDRQSQSKLKVHDNRQTFLFSVYEMFFKINTAGTKSTGTKRCFAKTLCPMI